MAGVLKLCPIILLPIAYVLSDLGHSKGLLITCAYLLLVPGHISKDSLLTVIPSFEVLSHGLAFARNHLRDLLKVMFMQAAVETVPSQARLPSVRMLLHFK
jgi:hypothetical protein